MSLFREPKPIRLARSLLHSELTDYYIARSVNQTIGQSAYRPNY